jgi:3-hydroxyacyl-CoA dehydrogenase/enoyl-CoA hydratase/3-hydroxybutyryl-CoA epimerase
LDEAVSYQVDADGVCTLTMDLPGQKLNVMGAELQSRLDAQLTRAVADLQVRGIIITSGKPVFLAGGDLKEMGKGEHDPQASRGELARQFMTLSTLLRRLETCGKPVACALNGTALGGGLEIALASHFRAVADDPKIQLGLPEATVGLMPGGGGTQRLARMLGVQKALPLLIEGRILSPTEALALGVVHAVASKEDLLATCRRWLLQTGDPVQPWDKKGFRAPGGSSSLEAGFASFFSGVCAMVRADGYGNYPAPEAICAAVYEGLQVPMDMGLRIEAKYFTTLMLDPVSGNLIRTMFINKGKADSLSNRPKAPSKRVFETIGVIGAGTMGAGIALTAARRGIDVVLIDQDLPRAERGKAYAERKLGRDVEKGRVSKEKASAALARIRPSDDYADLSKVQLAIETVFEDRRVKHEVIRNIYAAIPADAFIASNTSQLPITELAEASKEPERFVGMHFFSPAERMPLIEIIRGEKTSDDTLAWALDFAQALRRTPIEVNDQFGFFTSRFIGAFLAESLSMVEQGVKPALVENGARMLGMPSGALAICDSIGLDVGYHAAIEEAKAKGEPVPDLGVSAKLVEAGRNGMKNGKGFYDYGEGGSKSLWPGLAELTPKLTAQPSIEEVKARILYAQLAEGARAFADGVLGGAADGDMGAILGVGFPTYLGGPFAAMDTIGIPQTLHELDRMKAAYGARFAAPELLRDMAAKGQTYYGENAVTSPGARIVSAA